MVSLPDFRERLSKAAAPFRPVLKDRHQAGKRREHARLLDSSLVPLDIQLRLVQLLAQHCELRFALLEAILDVCLKFLLAPLRLFEREFILASVDRGK